MYRPVQNGLVLRFFPKDGITLEKVKQISYKPHNNYAIGDTMLTARDIMTSEVISVREATPVSELARILTSNNISGVPVLGDDEKIIAVVTESDLIDQSKKLHIPTVITILDSVFYLENPDKMEAEMKKIAGTKVSEICSGKPQTIHPETPLDEIATIMAEDNIHTIPVTENEKLVGVIGKKDIIKTLIQG